MILKTNAVFILFLSLSILFPGCSKKPISSKPYKPPLSYGSPSKSYSSSKIRTMLINEFRKWEGTPHKMGGYSKQGIDCSGFAHYIFNNVFHISVPRTTKLFTKTGKRIDLKMLKPGDIVIFRPHSYPRHVGIYVGNNEFIHASTSKGVMKSNMNNPYWKRHYWMSRRVLS